MKEALEQTKTLLDSSTLSTLGVNILVNFLQAQSLQYLWDMINAQQLMILLPLFNVGIPSNAMIFFGWLLQIASMEALPTDWIYSFFSKIPGEPISPIFEDMGFEHHLMLNNYGTLGFVFAMMPLLYFVHAVASFSQYQCCAKFRRNLGKKIYWGTLLRMLIEGYVIGLISCLINIRSLDFTEDQDRWTQFNSILSVIVITLLTLFPIIAIRLLLKNFRRLGEQNMAERYGQLTIGFNFENKIVIFY